LSDIFLGFKFHKDRLENIGTVGSVEFLAFPFTWHIA